MTTVNLSGNAEWDKARTNLAKSLKIKFKVLIDILLAFVKKCLETQKSRILVFLPVSNPRYYKLIPR